MERKFEPKGEYINIAAVRMKDGSVAFAVAPAFSLAPGDVVEVGDGFKGTVLMEDSTKDYAEIERTARAFGAPWPPAMITKKWIQRDLLFDWEKETEE